MQLAKAIGRPFRAFRAVHNASEATSDVSRVVATLREALDTTNYISESAQQAYLETDPSQRELPEAYRLRYMEYACTEIEQALSKYDELSNSLGSETIKALNATDKNLGLTLADTLLARDRLRAGIRKGARRIESMKEHGLKKENLTFCD